MTHGTGEKVPYNVDNDLDYANAFSIAEGMGRDEIERRARQVFSHANECRARYTSGPDLAKRNAAIQQALAWRNILRYLGKTGAGTFHLTGYRDWTSRPAHRLDKVIGLFSPRRWYLVFYFSTGTGPVTFHEFTDADQRDN
jgi:hypothetical protein